MRTPIQVAVQVMGSAKINELLNEHPNFIVRHLCQIDEMTTLVIFEELSRFQRLLRGRWR